MGSEELLSTCYIPSDEYSIRVYYLKMVIWSDFKILFATFFLFLLEYK